MAFIAIFSSLHSWICFASFTFFLSLLCFALILKAKQGVSHQIFSIKDVEGYVQRQLLQHNRRRLFDLKNLGNCKIFRLHIGWMEKITLNGLNLIILC